jgi:LysM repeat protein
LFFKNSYSLAYIYIKIFLLNFILMSYRVVSGDTLGKIASRFGTTYQELARINGISNPNLIHVGQVLKLPNSNTSNSSSSSSYKTYTIVSGDTLGKIANRFGTTYQEIARINGIPDPNKIQVGQVIKIPGTSSNSSNNAPNFSPKPTQSYNTYTIVSGDTLSKIANRFGTTYQELARINGISNPNIIQVGQVIKVPGSYSSSNPIPYPSSKPASNPLYKPPSQHPSNANNNQIFAITKNTKVLEALQKSQWSYKADCLSVAYYVLKSNGYSNECAIGLGVIL